MNILILTSIFPQEDDEENVGVTPVVEYFAKEWTKAGHNVLVIHNSSRYPKLLYLLPDWLLKKINSRLGIVIPNRKQGKRLYTKTNGITCYRIPMLKLIPKNKFSNIQIKKQYQEILNILKAEKYSPDIIIGHWENPQIPLLSMLKHKFTALTALVFHGIVYIKQNRYKTWGERYLKDIDVIGARSNAIRDELKELLNLEKEPFICYSGIADKYLDDSNIKKIEFKNKVPNSYLYVGRLIKRKNVNVSITALNKVYSNQKFNFSIVGKGAESETLFKITNDFNLNNSIQFLGYKDRDDVLDIMGQTEVFIMVSDHETFGLVYIEAMAKGCIVIASKGGGMDGIIIDGHNGFLCEQGNEDELVSICRRINSMPLSEKENISKNAVKTSKDFSDSKVAKMYLENILKDSNIDNK